MPHTPRMSADDAERLRRWHQQADAAIRAQADGERVVAHLGAEFVVPASVQPLTGMSDLLGSAVLAEVRASDRVLDMGTGCGVNAVLAARTAATVVAVDLNPDAVVAARANAARNGVTVDTRVSDVWSAVDDTFDLIVFDPPFRWFRPRDLLEAATTDEDYAALGRFFDGLDAHLRTGGRVLLFFGTTGDLDHVLALAAGHGFDVAELVARTVTREDVPVRYVVHRLARVGG